MEKSSTKKVIPQQKFQKRNIALGGLLGMLLSIGAIFYPPIGNVVDVARYALESQSIQSVEVVESNDTQIINNLQGEDYGNISK